MNEVETSENKFNVVFCSVQNFNIYNLSSIEDLMSSLRIEIVIGNNFSLLTDLI